ncbi:NAD+ diphosphatase [Pseudohyphozyma bogoriensis]|nr:NAD+ diphosphatase [Pseudohyphozyma bogoriensis]
MGSTGFTNYYAGNPLNRLSYLRQSPAFLTSSLISPKARFVVYNGLAPLLTADWKLVTLPWTSISPHLSATEAAASAFWRNAEGKDLAELSAVDPEWLKAKGIAGTPTREDKALYFTTASPTMVFLGVDERGAPESAKSLPLSKPTSDSTLESHSPYGVPYWALDVSKLPELQKAGLEAAGEGAGFQELRAAMPYLDEPSAAICGEGRALLDWNIRSVYCQACSRPMRQIWGGWKRVCVGAQEYDGAASCPSKERGVQNYSYPRTDPVVIMAITSPDRESILLGRQKVWPKKFYSALAGFLEFGESIEEAVRREVYEEAGVEVGEVYYHSSQPWPYPASLMIGAIGVAKPGQVIRTDLDNELEDARYFTRAEVLAVLDAGVKPMTKEEADRFDQSKEHGEHAKEEVKEDEPPFKLPAKTAIAHTLVEAWARNTYLGSSGKL